MVAPVSGLGRAVNMSWPRQIGVHVLLMLSLMAGIGGQPVAAEEVRVKDLGKLQGWRDNVLSGTGLVTGLAGTGDSIGSRSARQALSNVLSQFDLNVPPEQIQSRNVAMVMVQAILPPFAREGDTLDIAVTSMGDARSLVGGNLMITPLKAANGQIYALAQGALSVGGYRYDANGNVVQKNHPTAAAVPNGATVERAVSAPMMSAESVMTYVLTEPDFTTAHRVAQAINRKFGAELAQPLDASGISVQVPPHQRDRLVAFVAALEAVTVEPDQRAKVVINERTGTVVSGGAVRLSAVAISHGDLRIAIRNDPVVSQPTAVLNPGLDIRTVVTQRTQVLVDEASEPAFVRAQTTVADLVQSLVQLKTSTRDIISILRAIKAAGSLHAELIVQ